jgi:hypothetical protein
MLLHRAGGLLEREAVEAKKLVFLGLGSLGSLTLANLAYPWREIVLVDPETLEPENVERHLLGRRFLGRPKVEGAADYLIDKGVCADSIRVYQDRAQEVLDEHTDADLAIVNIDERGACYHVNTWCFEHNIPALYGGVYPRGTGGEVIVITDARDICYQCAAHKMGRDTYEGIDVKNYGLEEPKKEDAGLPALHFAISSTAADMADFALEILSGGAPPRQVFVRAHSTWEPILKLGSGAELTALTTYILSNTRLGLIANMKLDEMEDEYALKATRSLFSLVLERWDECPTHEEGPVVLDSQIVNQERDNG